MCGFIAQLVEHRTGIAEVTGSNPVKALIFSGFFFPIATIGKLTAMIIFHYQETSFYFKNTTIKQLCNHKVQDFSFTGPISFRVFRETGACSLNSSEATGYLALLQTLLLLLCKSSCPYAN